VRRAQASPASGQEHLNRPPPLIGAAALNATDQETLRELVMTMMGQEPGGERRGPRLPLLGAGLSDLWAESVRARARVEGYVRARAR